MMYQIKQKLKQTLPRHKKAYYGIYGISVLAVIVLSLML